MLQSERNSHMPKQVEVEEAEVQVSAVNITQTSNVLRGSPPSQTNRGQATSPRSVATNPLPSSARTWSLVAIKKNKKLFNYQIYLCHLAFLN